MNYTLNTTVFGNTFAVPSIVADKYLKIATPTQLKVLLYFMRNISDGINPQIIAQVLSLPLAEIEDALLFWSQCGVLNSEQPKETEQKSVIINASMPSRADVIKRGLEDESLMFLLREAQLKFGRNLKQNESQLLVALYDDYGMDVSVILLLLGYAVSEGKCNLSFVKKTAAVWLNAGVETVVDAERIIAEAVKEELAWQIVRNACGIEKRKPSTKELEYSALWINEYNFGADMIKSAYDICIDANAKLSMAYIAKILERWHKDGVTTPADIIAKKQQPKAQKGKVAKTDYAGYDLSKFEQMLNDKVNGKG